MSSSYSGRILREKIQESRRSLKNRHRRHSFSFVTRDLSSLVISRSPRVWCEDNARLPLRADKRIPSRLYLDLERKWLSLKQKKKRKLFFQSSWRGSSTSQVCISFSRSYACLRQRIRVKLKRHWQSGDVSWVTRIMSVFSLSVAPSLFRASSFFRLGQARQLLDLLSLSLSLSLSSSPLSRV